MATSFDPLDALQQFQQAIETFRSSSWLGTGPSGAGSFPPLNVFRQGEDIVVIAEVPGVRKSDLQIEIKDRTIRISGTKSVSYGDEASVHRRERQAGAFNRSVSLPIEVDIDRVKAECRDGILALHLPRAERDKPRTISLS
jgi:HSP20 family protein